ncbi:hypothetical protein EON82_19340 [bacterium]|nr:MAG: hypothetical protein EON82_19340 [bacterium]
MTFAQLVLGMVGFGVPTLMTYCAVRLGARSDRTVAEHLIARAEEQDAAATLPDPVLRLAA